MHELLSQAARDYLARDHHPLIDGDRPAAGGQGHLRPTDPATETPLADIREASAADVDRAVAAASRAAAAPAWRTMPPAARAAALMRLADAIERDADLLADLETICNGTPRAAIRNAILPFVIALTRYYAGWAAQAGGRQVTLSRPGTWHAYTVREPVGVVAMIVPWNAPIMLTMQKVAPALAAGCAIVLKPSELTPLTALRLGELALEAGIPAGVFNIVPGGAEAGAALVSHRLVDKISFTGSTSVGRAIAAEAGRSLKRVSLELGGKSPAILLSDADLSRAIPGVAMAIFNNSGQVCAAASRLFVHRDIHDAVVEGIARFAAGLTMGHGLAPETRLGPLISAAHRERVRHYIMQGEAQGARLSFGGSTPDRTGYFLEPAILTDAAPEMDIVREEIFGPVLSVMRFDDDDDLEDLARRANASEFGLAGSIWSRNVARAQSLAGRLEVGTVGINTHSLVDPALPFGGRKASGIGRECGEEGVLAFTETKSVAVLLD
ncbi:phenylacetaldehyde dehydrogenase [Sphingobium jiangsuense]|uniref:Phenylacetaldehyde dehydrogenase n=1 Tax=Sphingobium jiangsuense TaxID=870476 RepID=A0A7W6BCL3_9SPHN|nr:aldehyde dehydrogenase family protein [Sphingobium jiangsuense]MBB3924391.1 phenylacetaldehyde dehydrogenase [Sphingobium jiangsuense]GLT00698.1 phenylacetaldehyde dehydrogenase [Sphingobium jiangsuense]